MAGLSPDEQAAYHEAQAASVLSDANLAAFAAEWSPRLRAQGLDLDGFPLEDDAPPENADPFDLPDEEPEEGDRNTPPPPGTQGVAIPRSVAVSFVDFIAEGDDDEAEEWLVEGLVPKNGLTVLGGNPKTGKTLFALDLGFAVASGRPFLGRETARAGFLYVTEEGSPVEMRKRARRLLASGLPDMPANLLYRQGIRFDDARSWRLVRDALQEMGAPALLILDPLREMLAGDENDSTAIAAVGRAIRSVLSDFPGVTVMLLHHLAKRAEGEGGQRLRGSSALWGAADCILLFKSAQPSDVTGEEEVALRGKVFVEPRNAPKAVIGWE